MNPSKITVTFEDNSTVDFFPAVAAPTEVVHIAAGESVEVVADQAAA